MNMVSLLRLLPAGVLVAALVLGGPVGLAHAKTGGGGSDGGSNGGGGGSHTTTQPPSASGIESEQHKLDSELNNSKPETIGESGADIWAKPGDPNSQESTKELEASLNGVLAGSDGTNSNSVAAAEGTMSDTLNADMATANNDLGAQEHVAQEDVASSLGADPGVLQNTSQWNTDAVEGTEAGLQQADAGIQQGTDSAFNVASEVHNPGL